MRTLCYAASWVVIVVAGASCAECASGADHRSNTTPVPEHDVDDAIRKLPPMLRDRFDSKRGKDEMRRALEDKQLLAEEARRRGIEKRADIRDEVERLEERLTIQALLAEEVKASPPSDEELKTYWERNQSQFSEPERARVSRVFVALKDERAVAQKRADGLRARLVAGEPLASVSKEGDGPERARGGDLGFITREHDDQGLVTASFALTKPGDVSPVVETKGGFSVVVLSERAAPRIIPFTEARSQVENRMRPSIERRAFDKLIERLRKRSGDST